MVETLAVPFESSDILIIVEKLRKMYGETAQMTMLGNLAEPYPILRVGKRAVRGLPVSDSRLRYFEPIPFRGRVAAVDASIKVLFDLGTAKIVESKVAAGVWRGFEREFTLGPVKRLALIEDKREAGEWLLRLELEFALRISHRLSYGDYLLLDRGLLCPPFLKSSTRRIFEKLDRTMASKGGVLVGVVKRSGMSLNTGESVVGYVASLAESRLPGVAWYYHPLFKESALPGWVLGDISIVKFSELSDAAFRVDISWSSLAARDLERIIGELGFIQDLATPGYPYPLKAVHDMSLISEHEVDLDRFRLLDRLLKEGFEGKLRADMRVSTFKERYFWGSLG